MPTKKCSLEANLLHELWLDLSVELAGVFDAHSVCAIIGTEVALKTKIVTVIGISDPQRQHYDVWICQPDGGVEQSIWSVTSASFELILEAGQATRFEKHSRPVTELINSELWMLPQDEIIAVPLPLPFGDTPVSALGVLCLIDPGEKLAVKSDFLEDFSRYMTVYLDRAFLRQRVDRQSIEFAVVSDISHTLTSTLSLDDVFQQLTGTIRRTLNVEFLSVGLVEPHTGDIVFVDQLMGSQFTNLSQIRVKSGQGIAGWVAEHREPVIINDTYADQRFYTGADMKSGFRTNSMLCIPLQVENHTIGVLQAINRRYGEFTTHDLQLLQAIGGPLAAAIENARLHADVLAGKRRVETLFSNMSEGMVTLAVEGYITRTNDALGALLLIEPTTLYGQKAADVLKLREGDFNDFIANVLDSHDEYPQIVADLKRYDSGFVPVLISGAAIRDKHNRVNEIILTISDLSQIREVERMRDDLFQAIAHELRTPLATILMYARLLREGKARDEEKAARFLGVIERESDRLQRMVRRMMQLAKHEASELQRSSQPVYLNTIFEDILPSLADLAVEKGLLFRQKIEPDLPPILGDSERLEEIFNNVIVNAIKFTPAGNLSISATVNGDWVKVTINDQGIGIPKEAIPNLFNRFYRAQTAVERGIAGTGLGLYMVKQNVDNYNGTIEVTSSENKGTTFIISFPIYEG
jgi:two-component system, OmpR family, phosphate regulon sensor histidine kinase PhoR